MIGLISEYTDNSKVKQWVAKGYSINLVKKKQNPEKSWHQINWGIILNKHTNIVAFALSECYPSTKSLIYGALKNGKQVVAQYRGLKYVINSIEDQEYDNLDTLFQEQKEERQVNDDNKVRASNFDYISEQALILDINLPDEDEMLQFVRFNASEHDMKVNFSDKQAISLAFLQLKWYNKVELPSLNTENKVKCPICGHHTLNEFDGDVPTCHHCGSLLPEELLVDSTTYFGNMNYLDDLVNRQGGMF